MREKEYEFCLRCGRRLKSPETRQKGYGVVCEKKLRQSVLHPLFTQKAVDHEKELR